MSRMFRGGMVTDEQYAEWTAAEAEAAAQAEAVEEAPAAEDKPKRRSSKAAKAAIEDATGVNIEESIS